MPLHINSANEKVKKENNNKLLGKRLQKKEKLNKTC
jgi:hypothetical protein